MFYGVKKLEKPAEAEVEKVKVEVAENEFSQSSQSAERNFSQISQISQNSEKEFSQSSQCPKSSEKNFSQISRISQIAEKVFSQIPQISRIPQIAENPEESQDTHSKNFRPKGLQN